MASGLKERVWHCPQLGIKNGRFTALEPRSAPTPRSRAMPWHRSDMDNPLFREGERDAAPADDLDLAGQTRPRSDRAAQGV